MKNKLLIISVFLFTAAVLVMYPFYDNTVVAGPIAPATHDNSDAPRIQLAILLDTSSSMAGLINQTREQLWQVVNEFARSKKDGKTPKLQVAVYEYGNDKLQAESGYIRKVSDLTGELDEVSSALFSLTTDGGNEFCGYAINTAVKELAWSERSEDIKAIFIAGNEPFTQGPVNYRQAVVLAKTKGITVNTIHAGSFDEGASTGWQDGAILAGGDYMNIDHNLKVVHINAPQDKRIAELNAELNTTYVPYGQNGKRKRELQLEQDQKSQSVSSGLMAKRAMSKASGLYKNSTWDLVDAIEQEKIKLEEVESEALPKVMQDMAPQEQASYIKGKQTERKKIQQEIKQLSKSRDAYVKKERAQKPAENTMDKALVNAIRKQGEKKNYRFE